MADTTKPTTKIEITTPDTDATPNPAKIHSRKIDKSWWAMILTACIIAAICTIIYSHSNSQPTDTTGYIDIDNGDENTNWDRYATTDIHLSESLTISQSGVYHITGNLSDGNIVVDSGVNGEVKLILDNISIVNTSGPALACISGDELLIELVGDNSLADGSTYATNIDPDITGAIYSKADLSFRGDGSLTVNASYQDAIVGKDDVKFSGGIYTISAADDGIRGKDSVYIAGGSFSITSTSDGIKSTNDTDADKGFVLIEDGDIAIASGDDAIHAETLLTVRGGNINITKSYEGLEAPQIAISGGNMSIVSSDDGINAGGNTDTTASPQSPFGVDENCKIDIGGGNIYINASGDGIDSNGYVYFSGGKVVVDGPTTNGNGALDSGGGIMFNGGEVIAVGSSGMAESMSNSSNACSVSIYFPTAQSANTKIEIKDTAGDVVAAHTSAKTFSSVVIGSYKFTLGETYSIYINGTKYQDFTISSNVTTIGNSPQSPGMPPQGNR